MKTAGMFRWRWLIAATALVMTGALAQPARQPSDASWGQLSPQQRAVLNPLAGSWDQLTLESRNKWIQVAHRFPSMTSDQRQRVMEKMADWAKMSPDQRRVARLNFQQAQQVQDPNKQERWQAYQALPPEERKALAARAQPVPATPPNAASQALLRNAPLDAQAPKSNIVPPRTAAAPLTNQSSPVIVRANTGATTSLVNAKSTPPTHQQAGLPKIAASPGMVDKSTLLPKRGPQAAGALPASGAPMSSPAVVALPAVAASAAPTQ